MEQSKPGHAEPFPEQTQRVDIYAFIHKALRAFMCDTLTALGSADAEDAQEITRVIAQVRELVAFCKGHLEHENDFVHAAMEARLPGSCDETAADHVHHHSALARLASLGDDVEQAKGRARGSALKLLYRYFAVFVAENLTHMNMEETENNAVLWSAYTDTELIAIEHAIHAAIPPQEMEAALRWMIPAVSAGERALILEDVRMGAPAPVFDGMLGLAKKYLSPRDWTKLMQALALQETESLAA